MKKRMTGTSLPKFKSEGVEADWWASPSGRAFVKAKSSEARIRGMKMAESRLLSKLPAKKTVQIALRMPESDLAQARKIAERKGIGYQTLLKMLVREGLIRESRHT